MSNELKSVLVVVLIGKILSCGAVASAELEASHDRAVPSSVTGKAPNEAELLTLNRLRDSGLSLQQIKQQAINIYMEVTRKDVQPEDKAPIVYPRSISYKGLVKSKYLPARMEWLYFYVGTMEPIIHLYANDVSDTKAGATRLLVPKAAQQELSPVWKKWSAGIENLNENLTAIYKLANEDSPDNIAIGRRAVAMYKIAIHLERTREKGFAVIRKSEQLGENTETVGIE